MWKVQLAAGEAMIDVSEWRKMNTLATDYTEGNNLRGGREEGRGKM